ncbi:ABC transporter permease [Mesorhizobium sp. M4B.F.Ca.ET.049.02.1.2]|uniref:ABC transporter permease n=1 Tax=Mesorhizobium sp. M4B.F.Ca.ET.049.02.1.2 TaxID=2496752 RepID=UPI000FCA0279|nr:ABC transporter permease [Mesorhizobium sp. M4B.F.Ca.ET.049.02.1.2]RUW76604.1 ABC transporter permease [Mesorhizobium sp. M4B.F.Ca.ET.049.02.1.2]
MLSRFGSLLLKESIQFFRDRVVLALIMFLYVIDSAMCTLALSYDVKNVSLAVVDEDGTYESRDLDKRFFATPEFIPAGHPASEREAAEWLQSGKAIAAVIIPRGFAHDLVVAPPARLQVLIDGTNSNTALIARGYVLRIVQLFQAEKAPAGSAEQAMAHPVVRVWFNPSLTFTSFMVLSMIATAAMMVGLLQPAASIVREKEAGTIEQLMLTPIRTGELFLAKTLPTLATGLIAVFPSLLVAYWFGVPLRGSLLLFLALTALFLVSAIALGVLLGTVTQTLQQALLLSFLWLFSVVFLSGTLVPIDSMPAFLRTLSLLSPLRHYLDVTLGIFLKGSGIAELWPQAAILAGLGTVLYGLAWLRFARR